MRYENFKLSAYEYNISPHCIAQEPVAPRDQSRLLVIDRKRGVSQEG
ncbi:MAG: S-adenosylmethionine:tRNA ribosyltransferase-isomerase, partial [Candidatus Omnitrophota bacterium]